MNVLRLSPILLFFFLLTGHAIFLPAQAFATCCYTTCPCTPTIWCKCPGSATCGGYACRSNDAEPLQASVPPSDGTIDLRAVRNPDETERLAHLTKVSDCARRDFALRMLGTAGESLKVESFSVSAKNVYDGAVTLTVAATAER